MPTIPRKVDGATLSSAGFAWILNSHRLAALGPTALNAGTAVFGAASFVVQYGGRAERCRCGKGDLS
jgi:hypothetical protein